MANNNKTLATNIICDFKERINILKLKASRKGKIDFPQIYLKLLTNNTKCKKTMRNLFKDSWQYDYKQANLHSNEKAK